MKLVDSILLKNQYEDICDKAAIEAKQVFNQLWEMYDTCLFLLEKEQDAKVNRISKGEKGTKYHFQLMGNEYSLILVEGTSMMVEFDPLKKDCKEYIRYVVENEEASKHITGCIALTMRIENQLTTLMRIFVNSEGLVAYEYGMGWKVPLILQPFPDGEEKIEALFTQPLSSSLLEVRTTWSPFSEIRFIDNLNSLNIETNRIGFK
ncbi:hypothetical protein [Brevibacillus porteri]|uniref:hypothetical protein n=1 Tax=Brevibacillus porteri TaxID=2126350 RepID=UPI00363BE7D4